METRAVRYQRRFELPMLIAAVLVVPVLIVEDADPSEPLRTVVHVVDWVIWLAFLTEFVVMLRVVEDRWAWIRSHPIEVVCVFLTPPFMPSQFEAARLLRLLRILRLLRLATFARRAFTLDGVRYVGLLVVLVVLGGGTAFAQLEEDASTWDGVWWSIVTMATVGYGDLYPETDAGRVLGIAMMVLGVGFGSILIGAVAERFVSRELEEEGQEISLELEEDVDEAEDRVLGELRRLARRMDAIEGALGIERAPEPEPELAPRPRRAGTGDDPPPPPPPPPSALPPLPSS